MGGPQGQCIPSVYFSDIREIDNNKKFSSTPPFCCLPCVFFLVFVWTQDPEIEALHRYLALKIRIPVANTGKLRSIGQMPVVFSTNKTDSHDITEILLKVVLYTIQLTLESLV